MTVIPFNQLQPETLAALVEEFVTRDGAVHGHEDLRVESQVSDLLRQIRSGTALIVYDEATETCGVMSREQLKASDPNALIDPQS
jgi:hypothetical protein